MEQYQIDYYKSLSPTEQLILKGAAMKGVFYYLGDITSLLTYRQKLSQKTVKECIEQAMQRGLFDQIVSSRYSYDEAYRIAVPFLIYIAPELTNFATEWKIVTQDYNNYSYYRVEKPLQILSRFFYTLLHSPSEFPKYQQDTLKMLADYPSYKPYMAEIFNYHIYFKRLEQINSVLLMELFYYKKQAICSELLPLSEMETLREKIAANVSYENREKFVAKLDIDFYAGNFTLPDAADYKNLFNAYRAAVYYLVSGDVKTAVATFDKALKEERQIIRNIPYPSDRRFTFYYLAAILRLEAEDTAQRTKKILAALVKTSYSTFDDYLKTIFFNVQNNDAAKKHTGELMCSYLKKEHNDLQSLHFIMICFLSDIKPDDRTLAPMLKVVEKACASGYYSLACEAAFILDKWYGTPETAAVYKKIQGKLTYAPVMSGIARQEAWEKSLNMLLGLSSVKLGKTAKDKENSSRVIYLLKPEKGDIQPVLQTRNAKGAWSAGRNIALKTFFEGKTPGMTEQDLRVSKTVNKYGDYYGAYYGFSERALLELAGHPYLFLAGGKEIPIELVTAQPEIKVTKTAKGYTLQSDIEDFDADIFVKKETNTRYKVYELTKPQQELILILTRQNITVPEQGKGKLSEILGGISKHATIHSDLLTDDTQNVAIKKVQADSRIRVQLLPFGDGLKAELYSKPFGAHPPYCKPGVGGKSLIANEKGVQFRVERNLKQEKNYADTLLNDIQALESVDMSNDLIAFDNPLDSLHLLDVIAAHKEKCVVEWPEGERFKIKGNANVQNLNLQIKSKTNWFELTGELRVDEKTVLTIQQLMALMSKSHGRFIELKEGEFLALSDELKKRLDEMYTFGVSGKEGLQINKFASLAMGGFLDNAENLKADKAWKEFRARINALETETIKTPATLQTDLRPYQEEGFRWMARLAEWQGGACLADDMGLGKTVQALAVLLHRCTAGAALVVCPVSVMGNWIAETNRFAPTLNIKTLGIGNRRETLQTLEAGDVLVTSYGLLQSEEKLFAETPFATVILDEAHVIKNFATKTSKAIMRLQTSFRVALTGTPLQNHLGELWNLFNFINPGLLGSMAHFNDTFVKPDNDHARKYLKKLITPFILRRVKSAVLDELPPKTEILKKIQLSAEETAFYEALRRQAILNLETGEGNQGTKHLQALAEITKLRQASCHPALVNAELNLPSSKLNVFLEIADELIENKHRALVFSQFVSHLAIIRRALDEKGISYQYLDGSTPIAERERSVKKFQNGEGDLFLISLKAGGLGLNLTAADYVIHMDPWWNPAIEDQASDRTHRMGQSRPVTIYRLIAENTIEEKIIQLHHTKRDLAESLLEGSDQSARLSLSELISLIREG